MAQAERQSSVAITIPGARGTVEVVGAQGVRFCVMHNGAVVKSRSGVRPIAMRNGTTGELRQRGILPGFQSLWFDGKEVFRAGADTPTAARITMFAPLLLVALSPRYGIFVAVALLFLNIWVVKNSAFPNALRIALPITNTLTGAALLVGALSLAAGAS